MFIRWYSIRAQARLVRDAVKALPSWHYIHTYSEGRGMYRVQAGIWVVLSCVIYALDTEVTTSMCYFAIASNCVPSHMQHAGSIVKCEWHGAWTKNIFVSFRLSRARRRSVVSVLDRGSHK